MTKPKGGPAVAAEFWIIVRGPLMHQAGALKRLEEAMRELSGVVVEVGTTTLEAKGNAGSEGK